MSERKSQTNRGGKVNIIRIKKRDNPFVQIDKGPLNDPELSLKAKGLLAYLLSMPDDWQIYVRELSKHHKDGKYSVGQALNELIKAGYCRRQKRMQGNLICGYEYRIFEVKCDNVQNNESKEVKCPVSQFSVNRNPVSQFSVNRELDTTNKDLTNIDSTKKNLTKKFNEQSFSGNTKKDHSGKTSFKEPLEDWKEDGRNDVLASISPYERTGDPNEIEQEVKNASNTILSGVKDETFIKSLCKLMFKSSPESISKYRKAFIIYIERAFPGERFSIEYLHEHGLTGFDKNNSDMKQARQEFFNLSRNLSGEMTPAQGA